MASRVAARRNAVCSRDRTRGTHETLDYWGWQTCTEFGFYQTCEVGSRCFYTQGLNLLSDDDHFCMADYGIRCRRGVTAGPRLRAHEQRWLLSVAGC